MRSIAAAWVEPLNNGEIWHTWIDYDGQTMEVRISMSAKRPDQPHISASIDLATELKSQNVLLGFTSATGAAGNTHDVLHWHFRVASGSPWISSVVVSENAQSTTGTTSPKTLMIVMDASGSMNGRIDNVPKLDIAKTSASENHSCHSESNGRRPSRLRTSLSKGTESSKLSRYQTPLLSHSQQGVALYHPGD